MRFWTLPFQPLAQMAEAMNAEMPSYRVTISDVARGILEWGIKERPSHYGNFDGQFDGRDAPDDEGKEEGT